MLGLVEVHLQKTPNNSGCNIQGLIFLLCKTSLEIGSSESVHWLHSHQEFRFFVSFFLPTLVPPGSNIVRQPLYCLPGSKKEKWNVLCVCFFLKELSQMPYPNIFPYLSLGNLSCKGGWQIIVSLLSTLSSGINKRFC